MGKSVSLVRSLHDLETAFFRSDIILWDGWEPLDEALALLSESVTSAAKLQVAVARNIYFEQGVEVYYGARHIGTFRTLKDVLEALDSKAPESFEDSLDDVSILVKSNKTSEVIETIQQFANLKLRPNVYTDEERKLRSAIDNFDKNYGVLVGALRKNIAAIESYESFKYQSVRDLKNQLVNNLRGLDELLEKTKDRDVHVAVFASKKSGKSMIVNAILEEEYAPTSLELPTPTTICFAPNDTDNKIKLVDESGEKVFESAKDLSIYLKKKFESVNKEGKLLPEITIKYPKTGRFVNYFLYDTPGPDLAGSEHAALLWKAIEKSDVALFVVDYSKYAQSDEINLLKKILEEYREKKKKKLSLIVAVNKLDMMYQDQDSEKITTWVAEFIREKLKVLKIDELVVIPTSAIWYFYSLVIERLCPEARENLEAVDELDPEKLWGYDSYLVALEHGKTVLRRHFKVKGEIGTEKIKELSNFPVLLKCLDYIAREKIRLEKVKGLFSEIERRIKLEVMNKVELLKALESSVEEVSKMLQQYQNEAKKVKKAVMDEFENLKNEIQNHLRKGSFEATQLEQVFKTKKRKLEELLSSLEQINLRVSALDEKRELITFLKSVNEVLWSKTGGFLELWGRLMVDYPNV